MKKTISMLLAILMLFSLVACGSNVISKECYVCGSTKNVQSATIAGTVYYLCDTHYKAVMSPSSTSGSSSNANSTPSYSSKFEKYLSENKIKLTWQDVQYDQPNNRDKSFILTGTAELSNYYNYAYDDIESSHFCLEVTPKGGKYSDHWYIYCTRSAMKSLYDDVLEKGTVRVELVCKISRYEKNQSNMASVEYASWFV